MFWACSKVKSARHFIEGILGSFLGTLFYPGPHFIEATAWVVSTWTTRCPSCTIWLNKMSNTFKIFQYHSSKTFFFCVCVCAVFSVWLYLDIILYDFFYHWTGTFRSCRDRPGLLQTDVHCSYDMAPLCAHCCFFGILMATHVAPEYAHVCSVHLIPRLFASYGILRADRGEKQNSFHALQALWFLTSSYLYKMEFSYSKSPFCDLFFSSTSTTWTWVPIL